MNDLRAKKGLKFKFGDLIKESGLPRLRILWRKYPFSRNGIKIFYLIISMFFLLILSAAFGNAILTIILILIFPSFGIAAGLFYFMYGALHLLDMGREEKRHLYAVLLPVFIFVFAFFIITPRMIFSLFRGSTTESLIFNPVNLGIMFIFVMIVMMPIIITLFLNSGFFTAVTIHEFIMKRFKKLSGSKGFRISVLLFLIVSMTFLLMGSLFSSQDPVKKGPGAIVWIPLTLLFPFIIAILGFSRSIGILGNIRTLPEKAEVSFFIGILVYSVYAYLQTILMLLILVSSPGDTVKEFMAVETTLGFFLTIYYFTSILGVLTIGSMRIIKIHIEDEDH